MTARKLKLHRIDYIQTGTIKGRSIQLLPSKGVKQQQKIVVGDQKGTLQIVSIRKGDPFVETKVDLGSPIQCVEIVAHQSELGPHLIAVAVAQTVRGFSMKGKLVFSVETNLVEPIQHMWLGGGKDEFAVANSYVYNHYHDAKEVNYYVSTDKINSLTVLPISKVPSLTPLLACQDGTVYSLRDSAVRHRLTVEGIPNVVHLLGNDGGSSGEWVVYGTKTGQIGLVRWSRAGPSIQWRLRMTSAAASVTSMDFYDLASLTEDDDPRESFKQLIIGRDDGVVEVYDIKIKDDGAVDSPCLIYSHNFGDSIAAVKGGVVGAAGYPEIVVATQRGWIFGLTSCNMSNLLMRSDKSSDYASVGAARSDMLNAERKKQFNLLKNEVEQLGKKLQEAQTKARQPRSSSPVQQQVALPVEILAKMEFLQEEKAFYVSIESQLSISFCLIQCDSDLELVDVERNLAILSRILSGGSRKKSIRERTSEGSETNEDHRHGPFLATFRCQMNTTRLEMKLRCPERSTSDLVRVYVVPHVQSSAAARFAILKTFRIVCLCRHARCPPFEWDPTPGLGIGYGQLTLRGAFSLADVHNWTAACLPNVPDKIPDCDDEISFYFRSVQWPTRLSCHYKRGLAVFKSDNAAALFKLRGFISDQATKKNLQIDIDAQVPLAVTSHLLQRIEPQLKSIVEKQKRNELVRALREAVTDQTARNPNDDNWMSKEFCEILERDSNENGVPDEAKPENSIQDLYDILLDLNKSHTIFVDDDETFKGKSSMREVINENTVSCLMENLLKRSSAGDEI